MSSGPSFSLLRLLADGEFHSGSALAQALGVSRGTVWNAVRGLESAGIEIYHVRGRGYRLANALSLLDARAVAKHAGAVAGRHDIEIVEAVDSTNSVVSERARTGAASGLVVAAEWQASGRGRMGRSWHAGIGEGLTFSLLRRFEQGASALAGLSLAAGLAVARGAEKLGAGGVKLKWPNDVVAADGKLAGLLIEMHGDALGPSAAVIGIGMNVRLSDAVRARLDQPAADLESLSGRMLDRSEVLGTMLAALAPVLDAFEREGFAPLKAEWQSRHVHQDRPVELRLPDGRVQSGVARGVDDHGALLFECGNAVRTLHSAEVSLRAQRTLEPAAPARSRA